MTILAESERLLLRKFIRSDAKAYYQITRDPKTQDFVPYANIKSLRDSTTCMKQFECGDFTNNFYVVLEEKDSKKMIGAIFATRTLLNSFDMNILIDATYRRKGYMSEALSTFISSVIPNGSELIFVVDKTNIASYHTVTKLPGIIEVPFTGKLKETMYRFSLTTE